MEDDSKGNEDPLASREYWGEKLTGFLSVHTPDERQRALSDLPNINPGKVIRSLLEAWGYSLSARGRKRSDAPPAARRGRDLIEETLQKLFPGPRNEPKEDGKVRQPVPSLNAKLSGNLELTVQDTRRIVAALLRTWPEQLPVLSGISDEQIRRVARLFVVELLWDITSERSREWTDEEMENRAFRLVDEERVGVRQFIKDAGEQEGALIVAGARNILIGAHPVDTIRQFQALTNDFLGTNNKGILIFVFDAAFFEAGKAGMHLFNNFKMFCTAIEAFAFFEKDYDYQDLIAHHDVSWDRWTVLQRRCCAVMKRPPIINPRSGAFIRPADAFDAHLESLIPDVKVEKLGSLTGYTRVQSEHILPPHYPRAFDDTNRGDGRDLYWDVLVRPSAENPARLNVQYFIPPLQPLVATTEALTAPRGRGRPPALKLPIDDDLSYLLSKDSPGDTYDDAQRMIYKAARGRLGLDSGALHAENLNAAAALRALRFEVMALPEMLNLFPLTLLRAASPDQH